MWSSRFPRFLEEVIVYSRVFAICPRDKELGRVWSEMEAVGLGRWVVATVRDGSEMALADELLSVDIQAYCPIHQRWRKLPRHLARKTGKSRELIKDALLTGYLFVLIETSEDLATVHACKDVFGFVRTTAGPCFARASDIEALKEIERSGVHDARPRSRKERVKEFEAEVSAVCDSKSQLDAMQDRLAAMRLTDLSGKTVRLTSGALCGAKGEVERIEFNMAHLRIGMLSVKADLSSIELT